MTRGRTRSRDTLEALLDESLAETGGPPTAQERQRARRKLGLAGPRATSHNRNTRVSGIRYEKIAISLPLRAAESVRRAVKEGQAPSVSAYIAAAVEEKAKKQSLGELVDQWLLESGGPMTPAERGWADRMLGIKPRTKRRARRRR